MRQHTARVSMQWSALLDALGELVSASNDVHESDSVDDKQLDDDIGDVERAPSKKWLGRYGDAVLASQHFSSSRLTGFEA